MADILDRLEKLENLVRHDDEARQVCADARKEIAKLRGTGGGGGAVSSDTWTFTSGGMFKAPPPPSQTTQVKLDSHGNSFTIWWLDGKPVEIVWED